MRSNQLGFVGKFFLVGWSVAQSVGWLVGLWQQLQQQFQQLQVHFGKTQVPPAPGTPFAVLYRCNVTAVHLG